MTPPVDSVRWGEIKRLFDVAVDLAPADREAFLATACQTSTGAPDVALRDAVASLLAADEATESGASAGFLGTSPLTVLFDGWSDEAAGEEPSASGGQAPDPGRLGPEAGYRSTAMRLVSAPSGVVRRYR
ncbi:hypothetical protein B1759_10275 [Rubrivirga sp. SAORIC476]|uniref:hypothetical protein n=1 Tax=Rubrivirga sp. SAORIC476 TaxID=1961794 RepID=UPI000BA978E9|nr:hypothetical protein [Rubrivirga sp. SAORIC476]MAQ95828.1 hypothetical protein [Rhodothermaceae bacterium]MBC13104.1 hypothetical protein [Rhodothermaceae bacterium]PAP81676.1 hypothetical protein B1759_10275 [Rubrivirga sp. SAORIC476]